MTGYVAADPRDASRLYVSVGKVGLFRLDGATVGTVESGQIAPQPIGGFLAPGPIAVRSDGAIDARRSAVGPRGRGPVRVSTDRGANWSTLTDAFYLADRGFRSDACRWAPRPPCGRVSNSNGIVMRPAPELRT